MKATSISLALFLLSLSGCSSAPAVRNWTPTALGEITADRCIYYTEAEDFKEKAGGDIDYKAGASKGKCLGMRWGVNPSDFATYSFDLEETSPSTIMVIRAAFEGTKSQSYDVLIDGNVVRTATLSPTGGFGYTDKEWACFSVPLGRVTKGPHTLTIKPVKDWLLVNIDCLALGKANQ